MNNKDIILFILVICVIYLLYCNNKKESFANNEPDERIVQLIEQKFTQLSNESITDSIKNLGIMAKRIQEDGNFTFPANLRVPGDLVVDGNLRVNGKTNNLVVDGNLRVNYDLEVKGSTNFRGHVDLDADLWIEQDKLIGWTKPEGARTGSFIFGNGIGEIYINTTDIGGEYPYKSVHIHDLKTDYTDVNHRLQILRSRPDGKGLIVQGKTYHNYNGEGWLGHSANYSSEAVLHHES